MIEENPVLGARYILYLALGIVLRKLRTDFLDGRTRL